MSYEAIHYKLRNCNPFEKEYLDYEKLICSGLTTECALAKLRLSEIPPSGPENFSHLQKLWEREKMQSFTEFCVRYKNKVVLPTLGVPQKMFEFYLNKSFYTLNLEVHYLNMANICLHRATSAKFHPFTETNKDLLSKVREVMVGRSSIVFTRKTVVDKTHICKSSPQIFANRSLELMQANFNPTQCVNICLQDCTQDLISVKICKDSSHVRTNLGVSKIWSCRTFNG